MKAASILISLLVAMIGLAAATRGAEAYPLNLPSDGVSPEIVYCAADVPLQRPSEACRTLDCSESCPSECVHGMDGCCTSGMLLNLIQKPAAIVNFLVAIEETRDFRKGIEPQRLPEPP